MSQKPKPTAAIDPKLIALTAELILRAHQIGGELFANDEKTAIVVWLETHPDGHLEPFSAIFYEVGNLAAYRHIPGRPMMELQRQDSTNEEFQAMLRRAAGFPPSKLMRWPKPNQGSPIENQAAPSSAITGRR